MWKRMIVGFTALALATAACATGTADVRPFSDVQVNDFTFENDPTFPGRGIFRVTTTEPMICAIVWGETEALGNFNNSLSMNGTGIVEHDVLLPGAMAGETYFYRVQGSTADGTLYQSELATFTLPETDGEVPTDEDGSIPRGENLALGAAVVEVSSEFGDMWAAENAVDGDLTTEWSSAGDGDDAFITIDLGSPHMIAAVAFLTRSMADGSATASTFSIEVDGGQSLGPFAAGDPASPEPHDVAFTGQILRFEISSSTGGNTGAVEVQVFSAPSDG